MFGSSKKVKTTVDPSNIETLLGKKSDFKGTINCTGTVRLDGNFEGQIVIDGDILVGSEAKIVADIQVVNITISGNITGNITATGKIELLENAFLTGDVKAATFVVEEGAIFNGRSESIKNTQVQ